MQPIVLANREEESEYAKLLAEVGEEQAPMEWRTAQELARARTDFWHFCANVLGYRDLLPDHERLCDWIQRHAAQPKLILMPRYSFKSSIGTVGYALWCLLKQPEERLLIYSDTTEKAQGFLSEIKNHILGLANGGWFRQLLWKTPWDVDPQQQTWNQSAIVIKARTRAQREPSVDTAGIDTSKVGMHYDRILFDDIVSDKNVTTQEQMEKVHECYVKSLSLLKPGGDLMMLGTRWHFGDLYGRIIAENATTHRWQILLRKAEEDGAYPFASIGLTREFLQQKRAEQRTRLYSCLYQNEPVDDETAIFKASDFRFYQQAPEAEALYITGVLDAIPPPTGDHGDEAAITVVGADADHTLFLLDAVSKRMTPEQQLDVTLALHAKWRFRKFGLETNAFQRMLKTALEHRLRALRLQPQYHPFEIVEFTGVTQGHKEQRIEGLEPWHRGGLLRFPGEKLELLSPPWSTLAHQMLQFPHSQHDDLLDSLAYHLQLTRAGARHAEPSCIPYRSAAWAVKEEEREGLIAQQPRWRRRSPMELLTTGRA